MAHRLLTQSVVLAMALVAAPALASSGYTHHGTVSTSQHYCGEDPDGPRYDVTGTWNLILASSSITFNYKNPATGTHVVWSNLGAWTVDQTDPYRFTNSDAGGFITFEATLDPADGAFEYVIMLPDCSFTGWDRLVVGGSADRGRGR
jgi:hypothetical protein